jgi:hypothetical protein
MPNVGKGFAAKRFWATEMTLRNRDIACDMPSGFVSLSQAPACERDKERSFSLLSRYRDIGALQGVNAAVSRGNGVNRRIAEVYWP